MEFIYPELNVSKKIDSIDDVRGVVYEEAEAEVKRIAEQEMKEVKDELNKLVKGFKSYNRAEIKEILERILF